MRRAAVLGIGLLLAVACRTPGPGQLLAPDDARPQRLVESLHQRAAARDALRAQARLSLRSRDIDIRRPQRMAISRPASLRVEILGLFDQVAALLVTDGEHYQLYDARKGRFETGLVDAGLLWRVARVDLEPAEAVEILLGAPTPRPGLSMAEARLRDDGGIELCERDARGVARERFDFDASGRLRHVERLDEEGQLLWEGRFDDYRDLVAPDGSLQPFAFDVSLSFPRVDAEAELSFARVELQPPLPEELFVLKLPAGAEPGEVGSP